MTSLYLRGSIWWVRTDPVTGGRVSTGCRNRESAERWYGQREAAAPSKTPPREDTLYSYCDRLVRNYRLYKALNTALDIQRGCNHLKRLVADGPIAEVLTPRAVDDFVATRLAEGAARWTVHLELSAIRLVARLALRDRAWIGDPASLSPISWHAVAPTRERVLEPAEIETLLRALPAGRRDWLRVLAATGCRPQEAHLTEAAGEGLARVRGHKTRGSDRLVPILPGLPSRLWRFVALPVEVWPCPQGTWHAACERAGIEYCQPRDIRRSWATWCQRAGVASEDIARALGHTSTSQVSKTYGRITAGEILSRYKFVTIG